MEISEAIERFRGPLTGLIVSWGAPIADASELAQDSLADAYMSRKQCVGDVTSPDVFARWLRGFARNKFRNWLRGHQRRKKYVATIASEALEQMSDCEPVSVDPKLQQLREEIDRLPAEQRQVILMHYLEETCVKDVAALIGVTPKAVEGRLYQGRRRLKQRLEQLSDPGIVLRALLL
ncbi:MAG: hypothetical protein Aurels2KO_52190 [Aureliella sp.]